MTETLQPPDAEAFKKYLQTEFGVANPDAQNLIAGLFVFDAIKSIRDLQLLPYWNPIEAARQRLIADGLENPNEQYPFLKDV